MATFRYVLIKNTIVCHYDSMEILEAITGSKSRARVFQVLFENHHVELYFRELVRKTGLSIRPIQQEVARLSEVGLLKSRKDGNRLYYSANSSHPLFVDIRQMVEKTSGYRSLLQQVLLVPEIHAAFIFGSMAKGVERPDSDLDLFVVGDLGLRHLIMLMSGIGDRIGREINPYVLKPDEFAQRLQTKHHFVTSVMDSKREFLVGNEDVLKRLGRKRLSQT